MRGRELIAISAVVLAIMMIALGHPRNEEALPQVASSETSITVDDALPSASAREVDQMVEAPLEPVSNECGANSPAGYLCSHPIFQPIWKNVGTADHVVKYNTKTIRGDSFGHARVMVYSAPGYAPVSLDYIGFVQFDCKGNATIFKNGQIAQIKVIGNMFVMQSEVCEAALPMILKAREEQREADKLADYRAKHPRPEDYCVGFNAEDCATIKRGVDSRTKPEFCNLKFSSPDVDMSDVNRRICYAREPVDNP